MARGPVHLAGAQRRDPSCLIYFFKFGQRVLIAVRWCVVDTRKLVEKPQEQGYNEHSSKFSLSCETKVY
jgi:hypothetical protein